MAVQQQCPTSMLSPSLLSPLAEPLLPAAAAAAAAIILHEGANHCPPAHKLREYEAGQHEQLREQLLLVACRYQQCSVAPLQLLPASWSDAHEEVLHLVAADWPWRLKVRSARRLRS